MTSCGVLGVWVGVGFPLARDVAGVPGLLPMAFLLPLLGVWLAGLLSSFRFSPALGVPVEIKL